MTVEDCRVILKVHIAAAEQSRNHEGAFSLLEALQAIDDQLADDRRWKTEPTRQRA